MARRPSAPAAAEPAAPRYCAAGYNSTTGACSGAVTGYAKPSWQTGTGVPADSVRDIPDVSLFAADGPDYSYYAMCYQDGDCQPNSSGPVQIFGVGGTSASAPSFAGIMALVDQKYGRQGQADFVLYPLKAQFPAAFHDVTNGTNSVPCESLAHRHPPAASPFPTPSFSSPEPRPSPKARSEPVLLPNTTPPPAITSPPASAPSTPACSSPTGATSPSNPPPPPSRRPPHRSLTALRLPSTAR